MTTDVASAPPVTPNFPSARRAASRRDYIKLFIVFFLLAVAFRLPGFVGEVFNTDETFLATQAEVINDGGNLYQEAADRKPPLVPYIYAATFAIFGTTALWSVRLMAMVAIALTALLLAAEARRRWGERAGWAAGLLMVAASVAFAPQDGQAANFEVFMLPAMTAAVLLAQRKRAFSSGVAVAIATLAKQTGAATLLPVLYILWRKRGVRGAKHALGGFALPLAIVALAVGPGDLLYWTTIGNGSYLSVNDEWLFATGLLFVMTVTFVLCNLPITWTLPRAWRERKSLGRDDVDLWLWLLSGAISVALGLRFFGHYYIQVLPPLCLLTTSVLVRSSRRMFNATVAAALLIAVPMTIAGFIMRPFDERAEYEPVSTYLKHRIGPLDRILVWGQLPEIYWASGARPATRFITSALLTGYDATEPTEPAQQASNVRPEEGTPELWRSFYEDLALHPPQYILDATLLGVRGSQGFPISRYPDLARIVYRDYRYDEYFDGITVYERKADAPAPVVPSGFRK
jgi:4-amino-4-deoxy-L-arabinose transferase-like glycosyltransferase